MDFLKIGQALESKQMVVQFDYVTSEYNFFSNLCFEWYYIYEGEGYLSKGTNTSFLEHGFSFIILPNTEYTLSVNSENSISSLRYCKIIIPIFIFKQTLGALYKIPATKNYSCTHNLETETKKIQIIQDDSAQNLMHLLWLIAHEYNHFSIGSDFIISNSLVSALLTFVRLYETQYHTCTTVITKNYSLDELLKFIRYNYGMELSLDFLANYMHLSKEYLCRLFKKTTGKTISNYILEIRIEKAMDMLQNSSISITDIGSFVGYTSISSFQRSFKKYTGVSPKEYKRNAQVNFRNT